MPASSNLSSITLPMPGISLKATAVAARSACWTSKRDSFMISTCQPVNCAAKRAFWPDLPMASDSWSSSTMADIRRSRRSIITRFTTAGLNALDKKIASSSLQGTMSIRSLLNSRTTACTREPFIPTHAPTGSIRASLECTAILARSPGSRAMAFTSMVPS